MGATTSSDALNRSAAAAGADAANMWVDKRVMGDRFRLEQALSNFLQNAVTYSPVASTIHVRVNVQDYVLKPSPLHRRLRQGTAVAPSGSKAGAPKTPMIRVNVPNENNVEVRARLLCEVTFSLSSPPSSPVSHPPLLRVDAVAGRCGPARRRAWARPSASCTRAPAA